MSEPNVLLSVVVCTFNRVVLLEKCLDSLQKQTLDPSIFEIIVIDNNSTDSTREFVTKLSQRMVNIRLVHEIEQGAGSTRNRGWRESQGKYVIYIDDDEICVPTLCERYLHAFENIRPQPAAMGGTYYPQYEETPPSWFDDSFEIRSWGNQAKFLGEKEGKYGFAGGNTGFPRRVLEEYGGFSSKLGPVKGKIRFGDETEFFYRLYKKEPWFWYDPEIKIFHWTPKRNFKLRYRIIRAYMSSVALASFETYTYFYILKQFLNIFYCSIRMILFSFYSKKKFVIELEKISGNVGYIMQALFSIYK